MAFYETQEVSYTYVRRDLFNKYYKLYKYWLNKNEYEKRPKIPNQKA